MDVILPAEDSESDLIAELRLSFPEAPPARLDPTGLVEMEFGLPRGKRLPWLAFARQVLPDAHWLEAESIRSIARETVERLEASLPEDQPWALHIEPFYGKAVPHRVGARAFHTMKLGLRVQSPKSKVENPGAEVRSSKFQVPSSRSEDIGREGKSSPGQSRSEAKGPLVEREAGRRRCELIRKALLEYLQKKRRHLLRNLCEKPRAQAAGRPTSDSHPATIAPFAADDSLVQLLLTDPGRGVLSVAVAPTPWQQRHLLSRFPKGGVPLATDKAAPSRAFAKLVEAELRLGERIGTGQTCVDLGAAPGSWTYVAANRGARVIAVDRSPLRPDLMQNRLVRVLPGDAFHFEPPQQVDWLLCDVIAPPKQSAELLLKWLRRGWCRRFVVTIKLKDTSGLEVLSRLKCELPPLTTELFLLRLCANKKEICAFGIVKGEAGPQT